MSSIAQLNFDLKPFFKIKCGQKYVPHPSNTYHTVWYVYGTELVRCVPTVASRALSLVVEKYLRTSLASALAAGRRVRCLLLISFPSMHTKDECQQEN